VDYKECLSWHFSLFGGVAVIISRKPRHRCSTAMTFEKVIFSEKFVFDSAVFLRIKE
jgi:hypothetical protein